MYNYFHSLQFKITLAFSLSILILYGLGVCAILIVQTMATSSGMNSVAGHERELVALMMRSAVALMIGGTLVALIAARHLIKVVCGGLHRQTGKFGEMASFLDFSKRSASPRKDEFGQSAKAFDGFLQSVEDAVVSVMHSTASVTTATREIAAGNMDLSIRTEQQAAALEQTAHSMQRLTDAIRRNTDNALRANELAGGANTLAFTAPRPQQKRSGTWRPKSSSMMCR